MAYNFNEQSNQDIVKAPQWLKKGYGVYSNGKPPVDDSLDNNYQNYADNAAGTGAIPTFKQMNSSNRFEITAGHTLIDNSLTLNAVANPSAPTLVVNGTAGSTTYTYKVVGRAGGLVGPSATASVTTGNATLSATNSITGTFTLVVGYLAYDIYRTVGGATQGLIATISAVYGPNVQTPTMSFTDTGLTADGSTAPTVNSTGAISGDVVAYGNLTMNALSTPATPLVVPQGTVGSTSYSYKIVARSGSNVTPTGHSAASTAGSTTTGNATLSAANYNLLTWQPTVGAISFDVYRTVGGATQGLIGNTAGNSFKDTGLAGDSSTAPTTNNTGVFTPANGSGTQPVGTPTLQVAHATYNFATDGGTIGLITPAANFSLPANAIIYNEIIDWTTQAAGAGGSASIGVSGTGGGAAILQAVTVVASLTGIVQGVIVPQTASGFKKITTAGGQATLTISGVAFTAGVCEIYVFYVASSS